MPVTVDQSAAPAAIRVDLGAIFVSLELSKSTWLVTSLSPGSAKKMSRHTVVGGDIAGLFTRLGRFARQRRRPDRGKLYPSGRDPGSRS